MEHVNILIKPASSACNMNCDYCFYHDVAQNRQTYFEGMISEQTIEQVIKQALEYAKTSCTFAYQGGEPTLRGLDFFEKVVALQQKYNTKNIKIHNTIQTNGTLITTEWAKFFEKNNFLVGLSLDGVSALHNKNRKFNDGKDTFNKIMQTVAMFDKYKVDYNILSVITGQNARSIIKNYNFFKKNNFKWIQFIPCLEPLQNERGNEVYHLNNKAYSDFLITLFDLWESDFKKNNYISIRYFDNLVRMTMGQNSHACSMNGVCSIQFVVEGDGSVYPCDFYVLDEWKLGNIHTHKLSEIHNSDKARQFVSQSFNLPQECRECEFVNICRNGCRRDRVIQNDIYTKNYYCTAYKSFFESRIKAIKSIANMIK